MGEQEFQHGSIASIRGQMKCGGAAAIRSLDIGAVCDQYFRDFDVVGNDGVMQGRRASLGMTGIDVGAGFNEQRDDLFVAGPHGIVQYCAAQRIDGIHGYALLEQRPDTLDVARSDRFMQLFGGGGNDRQRG